MKKICIGIVFCIVFIMISGCSVFVATPHIAHIPIKGVNNEVGEYAIVMENPLESDLDIKLTDRYAVRLDFQWLWNEQAGPNVVTFHDDEDNPSVVAPWVTLKYRF